MADIPFVPIYDTNWDYHNPTGEEFPIMASDARPTYPHYVMPDTGVNQYIRKCEFIRLRNCGFNLVRLGEKTWNLEKHPDEANGTGVSISATTIDINKTPDYKDKVPTIEDFTNYYLNGFVDKFKNIPNISMFDFGDELTMDLMRKIAVPYNIAREQQISQLPIFNRGVIYNAERGNRREEYMEELHLIQDLFHPAVWSYDRYPIFMKTGGDEDGYQKYVPVVSKDMYLCLEMFKDISDETKRPFWSYILCTEYNSKEQDRDRDENGHKPEREIRRLVSEEFMRFAVFSSIAYGTKGLRYWTYTLREEKKANDPTAFAPIDTENNITEAWYWVQHVNSEVHALESIFLHSDVYSVKAFNLYSDIATDPLVNHLGQFAQTYNAVRTLATGRLLLWNILGYTIYKQPDTFSAVEELVKPSMWCNYNTEFFSQECDSEGKPLAGRPPKSTKSCYAQLEAFMKASRQSGRPFWHYVSCMSYWLNGRSYMFPVNEAIMHVAAFAGLAYGAKGIRWWGYAMRKSTSGATYFHAPIDADGNRTYVWEMVKWVNDNIRRFGDIFLNAREHEVYHTGDTTPDGTTRAPEAVGPFLSFKADGRGVLLSLFSSGEKRYALVVNHEAFYTQEVTVSYNPVLTKIMDKADNTWAVLSTKVGNVGSPSSIPDMGEGKVTTETCNLRPSGFALIEYIQHELNPPTP